MTSQIFAMDTVMDFAVYGENAQAALTAASQEINALEQRLSRTRAGSEISTLNETGSAELSDETVQLLQSALALSDETGGAFDITIAPLVTAWGITSDTPRVPSQEEIESLLKAAIGYGTIADLWVNPDCGLKTRDYEETKQSLRHLVDATKAIRASL